MALPIKTSPDCVLIHKKVVIWCFDNIEKCYVVSWHAKYNLSRILVCGLSDILLIDRFFSLICYLQGKVIWQFLQLKICNHSLYEKICMCDNNAFNRAPAFQNNCARFEKGKYEILSEDCPKYGCADCEHIFKHSRARIFIMNHYWFHRCLTPNYPNYC